MGKEFPKTVLNETRVCFWLGEILRKPSFINPSIFIFIFLEELKKES
jgi:hypothetical protein